MKRIFIFITTFNNGGAEHSTLRLATGLHEIGYQVSVVVLNGIGELRPLYEKLNIIDLKIPHQPRWLICPRALGAIKEILKKSDVDIIFSSHNPQLAAFVMLGVKLSGIKNVPVYNIQRNTFSGTLQQTNYGKLWHLPRRLMLQCAAKWAYPKFDKIIAVSDGVKDDLIACKLTTPDKVLRIYNPVVRLQDISKANEKKSGEEKIILGVGALIERKGFEILIWAFAKLADKRSDLRLIIVGEGCQHQKLEKLIASLKLSDRVELAGYQQDTFSWYRKADVFVLSSLEEGLPRVLIEAMACGATPVSTDCPSGPHEILDGGKYGYLVPVGDVEKMAEVVETALEHPIDAEILKDRASFFSVENSIKQYVDLIEGRLT